MKRLLLLSTVFMGGLLNAQTIEVYGGPNFSKLIWKPNYSLANLKNYQTGSNVGIMFGPKHKRQDGLRGRIEPHFALEFFSFKSYAYRQLSEGVSTASWGEFYKVGAAVPIRFKITETEKRRFKFYGLCSPGYAFTIDQNYQDWSDNPSLASFGDLSVDLGIGTVFQFGKISKREKRQNKKYGISGLSLFVSRSYDLNSSIQSGLGSAKLYQYNINLGLKFSTKRQKILDFGKRA